jgi:hypothetical protein
MSESIANKDNIESANWFFLDKSYGRSLVEGHTEVVLPCLRQTILEQ